MTTVRHLNLPTSPTLGTFLQEKRRVCIQFLLTDEGCWEHNVFLCSSVWEKEIHLERRSCPAVPGRRHYSYFSLLSSGLQSKNIHVISSGFAGPYKPRLALLSRGHSELWLHLPVTNYLDVLHLMKTNGLCNSCDCRCAAGQSFNPLAILCAPSIWRRVALYVAYQTHLGVNLGTETQNTSAVLGFHNPIALLFLWRV